MNDFNKPIRPISKKDDDKIKVEHIIEKFKEQPDLKETTNNKKNKNNFIATYLGVVKKFFNALFYQEEVVLQRSEPQDLRRALQEVKILLEKIRNEDPTHDLKFAEELSRAWCSLLDCHHSSPQSSSVDSNKIYQLIDAIEHYPPHEEHSLGFYLTRYSEKEWFPIPFFQLLSILHEECWELKKSSHLDGWISLADEILSESKNI